MTTPNWQHHSKKDAKRTLKTTDVASGKSSQTSIKASTGGYQMTHYDKLIDSIMEEIWYLWSEKYFRME